MRPIDDLIYKGCETQEETIVLAKHLGNKRHRCCMCGEMSYYTQKVNGGPWYCYDGCFSTRGVDTRTVDGKPAWLEGAIMKGETQFGVLV